MQEIGRSRNFEKVGSQIKSEIRKRKKLKNVGNLKSRKSKKVGNLKKQEIRLGRISEKVRNLKSRKSKKSKKKVGN